MTSMTAVRTGFLAAACLWAATASAQSADAQGAPGLLGRSPHQDLEVTLSTSGAYDDNLVALVDQTLPNPETQVGGAYQDLTARLQYRRRFRYASFNFGENSMALFSPSLNQSTLVQHAAAGAFTFHKGQTTVTLSQTALSSPFYAYAKLPVLADSQLADVPGNTADGSVSLHRSNSYGSTALVSQGLGRRFNLALTGTYQNTKFDGEQTELTSEGASGRLTYRLTDSLGLVAGYGQEQGMYLVNSVPSTVTVRTYNLGADFSTTLSMSRRTTFAFHTGTAAVESSDHTSVYQLIGDARVLHQLSRSWRASAQYTRGIGLIDGVQVPTLSNALAARLDGGLSRRVSLSFLGGYSRDQIGVTTFENMSNTFSGSTSMHVALSHLVSMSTTYMLYSYRFDQNTALPQGVPQQFHRQELRFGFDVWLPLVR